MRKVVILVICAFVLGLTFAPAMKVVSKTETPVFASEAPNRFQLHAQIVTPSRRILDAYCDTGNGTMVYLSYTDRNAGGLGVSTVPNGCHVSIEKKE